MLVPFVYLCYYVGVKTRTLPDAERQSEDKERKVKYLVFGMKDDMYKWKYPHSNTLLKTVLLSMIAVWLYWLPTT